MCVCVCVCACVRVCVTPDSLHVIYYSKYMYSFFLISKYLQCNQIIYAIKYLYLVREQYSHPTPIQVLLK